MCVLSLVKLLDETTKGRRDIYLISCRIVSVCVFFFFSSSQSLQFLFLEFERERSIVEVTGDLLRHNGAFFDGRARPAHAVDRRPGDDLRDVDSKWFSHNIVSTCKANIYIKVSRGKSEFSVKASRKVILSPGLNYSRAKKATGAHTHATWKSPIYLLHIYQNGVVYKERESYSWIQ